MSGDCSKGRSIEKCFTMGNSRDEVMDLDEYKLYFEKKHEKLTSHADRLFGQKFWSHSITKLETDCVDYVDGCYSVAASAIVKISLNNGIYHEDLGCGFSFNLTNKAISISNARQDAKLDAFRKAIISFGYTCEREEYMEINKNSRLQSPDFSMKNKKNASFHPYTADQSAIKSLSSSSPRNSCTNVSLPSPKVNVPVNSRSEQLEHDIRAERKRKQQQLQEEYRTRMKLKEKQQCTINKENSNAGQFLIDSAIEDEPTFLSTQEVDEMMKSAAVLLKPESSNYRMPLISSPAQNSDFSWSSTKNCMKTPENSRNNRMLMN